MKRKRLTGAMASVVCVGALAPAAGASPPTYLWDHPCPCDGNRHNTLTCEDPCGELPDRGPLAPPPPPPPPDSCDCWCEGDWDDPANWVSEYGDYPDHPNRRALIVHSNTGCCNDYSECSLDEDCSFWTCDYVEDWLVIHLVTVTIGWLDLITDSTNADTDKLDVRFESKGTGAKTLTANRVFISAIDGQVTLTVADQATLRTDPTD